jgi:hypothetical protein
VGLGQGREGSRTARHNILANPPRLGKIAVEVQVIRHMGVGSFAQTDWLDGDWLDDLARDDRRANLELCADIHTPVSDAFGAQLL